MVAQVHLARVGCVRRRCVALIDRTVLVSSSAQPDCPTSDLGGSESGCTAVLLRNPPNRAIEGRGGLCATTSGINCELEVSYWAVSVHADNSREDLIRKHGIEH